MAVVFAGSLALRGGQAPPANSPLFSSADVLELRIEAPFNRLFDEGRDGKAGSVTGTLSYKQPGDARDVVLDIVELTVRGHSSRRDTECSFPKLRLKLRDGAATAASPFRDDPVVKIGTHCGEMPDAQLTPQYGRWANEKAAHREALVYRLLQAVGVRTQRVRPARIVYVFSDAKSSAVPDQAKPIVRDAFLLEDEKLAMKRMGATGRLEANGAEQGDNWREPASGSFDNAAAQFRPRDSAQVAFAEAMVGNFDWGIRFAPGDSYRDDKKGLWNVFALSGDNGAFPVPYDFDLAGMVTGNHPWFPSVFEDDFLRSGSRADVEVFAQVQRTRALFPRSVLNSTRNAFVTVKDGAYAVARSAAVDEYGRRLALEYLDAFYSAIESDDAFYVPAVAKDGVRSFEDPTGRTAYCDDTPVPLGTPVSVQGQQGEGRTTPVPLVGTTAPRLVPVRLLDVMWRFAVSSPSRCDAIRQRVVWLDPSAVDASYAAVSR